MPSIPRVIVELKPSKIGGIGLFAAQDIAKDDIVAPASEYSVSFHSWDEFNELDEVTQKRVKDFCLGDEKGFYAPPNLNFLSAGWYMNHSCNPNIAFNDADDFIALKDINKGEELVWDYGYGEANPSFRMECLCGSENCRKIITGNDWRDPFFREKNSNFFLSELKKEIS